MYANAAPTERSASTCELIVESASWDHASCQQCQDPFLTAGYGGRKQRKMKIHQSKLMKVSGDKSVSIQYRKCRARVQECVEVALHASQQQAWIDVATTAPPQDEPSHGLHTLALPYEGDEVRIIARPLQLQRGKYRI